MAEEAHFTETELNSSINSCQCFSDAPYESLAVWGQTEIVCGPVLALFGPRVS